MFLWKKFNIERFQKVIKVLPFELKTLVKGGGLPIEIDFLETLFNPRKYERTGMKLFWKTQQRTPCPKQQLFCCRSRYPNSSKSIENFEKKPICIQFIELYRNFTEYIQLSKFAWLLAFIF